MPSLASFRDPGGFCFVCDKRFFRAVSPDAAAEISPFLNSDTAKELIEHQHLIASRRLSTAEQEEILRQAGFRRLLDEQSIGAVFEHKRIDFPSYPYEWAQEFLFSAALLTLDLAQSALKEGYCLKDANPYNILYQGCDPVFIDLLSFERRNPRDPIWKPHSQFCRNFLLPLLAHKHWGIGLRDIFGTRRDGLDPTEVYRLCSMTQKLRRPFFSLVSLPTWLSRKATTTGIYRERLLDNREKAGFILTASFGRLRRALQAVQPARNGKSHWTRYSDTHSYSETAFRAKEEFLSAFLRDAQPGSVLDIGANTGHFSALAAKSNAAIVAIDSDAACIGMLSQRAKAEKLSILPLVVDLSRPSAAKGWRNSECARFLDRAGGAFDAAIFFGVLHHLLVTERVPLKEILDLAAELTRQWLVIEFIAPQDEMFKVIARGRDALYSGLTKDNFEAACKRVFAIVDSQRVPGMNRWLYTLSKLT
jgi:SAM-dependent methyltransferase